MLKYKVDIHGVVYDVEEVKLSDIEKRIKRNNEKYGHIIEDYKKQTEHKGLEKGRVRLRNPEEQWVLDRFNKK
nr:hypothetical protein [Heyndrickxia oleronia]